MRFQPQAIENDFIAFKVFVSFRTLMHFGGRGEGLTLRHFGGRGEGILVCVFFVCLFVLVVVFFLNIERCSRFSQGLKFSLKKKPGRNCLINRI